MLHIFQIEGLAKHLRCVGIDAALPSSKKPDPRSSLFESKMVVLYFFSFTLKYNINELFYFTVYRELLNQAYKEKRVLLTRDIKLLRYQYLAENQVYKVRSLLKNDQLLEVNSYCLKD
jgi:uncharacterized protein